MNTTPFPANSRYNGIPTAVLTVPDGTPEGKNIVYLTRRFVPPPQTFQLIQEHTVTQGERLDNIAAQYLGDPELFWRLCDANGAIRPEELIETAGRKLRITLPEGVQGSPNA